MKVALRLIVSLAFIAAIFSGCFRDPSVRKQKYFESGQRYFEKGKYPEASIQFLNALKIDSNYAAAHYQLAQSYLKMQQPGRAFPELARAVELQPENYQARLDMDNLLIVGRNFSEAKEQTNLLLHDRPNDPQVHFTVSNLLAAQGDLPGAIGEMQKAVALDPARWESYLNLALLQMRNSQPDAAEANFKKVIELTPQAAEAHVMLGTFYQSRNRWPEAEQQYHTGMTLDPKSVEPRAALARLYLAEGKKSEAEEFLKQAKRDFPDNSAGYRMLGDFYFTTGDVDNALAEYASLYQEHPKDLQVKKNYIQLLIQKNRPAEAGKLDDELLKANPSDTDALIYRGQVQILEGNLSAGAETLQTVVKNDPNNAEAHNYLGAAWDKLGNLENAKSEWREAVRLRPDLTDAQRSLAVAAMRTGDMSTLAQASTQLISLRPASPDGYALRAVSEINQRQFAAAEQDARKAIEVAPQSSQGYVQMGNLEFVQKQYNEAEKAYRQALDRDPNSRDALRGLINTYVAQKRVDDAIAAAQSQIGKSPNNSGFYDLLGTVLFYSKKDVAGAEAAFEKAAGLDKNDSDALLKLAQVQAAQGAVGQALATCQQGLLNSPREVNFYLVMGELYESRQNWSEAANSYQKALEMKPSDPVASDNLASVLVESGGNLDVALSLAQTARRGMPDSPKAADTLGWIFYQKGSYQSAIGLFQEAIRLAAKINAPDNPGIHYHLGLAYEKDDQPALARQQLERVLKIDPNYTGAADVKKQLAQMKS